MSVFKITAISIILLSGILLFGKQVPRDVIFYGLDHDISRMKLAAVSVEQLANSGKRSQLGSGCLISTKDGVSILTCHHLFAGLKEENSLVVGINSNVGKMYFSAAIIRSDSVLDLSLLEIQNPLVVQIDKSKLASQSELNFAQTAFDTSLFATNAEIREGLSALMIGFPLGLGSGEMSNYPVSRIGIIAQVIPNSSTFLIDGMTSHGNSGSPVFSGYAGRFIGIIQGGPADRINAYDENQQLVVSLPYNSGLSLCISAQTIKRFLFEQK